jgi:hypothetical protein
MCELFYKPVAKDNAMPRKARRIVDGEGAAYHFVSRSALPGYVLGDVEKDYLLKIIRHLSSVYPNVA